MMTDDQEARAISFSIEEEFPFDALTVAFKPPVEALMEFHNIGPLLPAMSALGVNAASLGSGLQVQSNRAMTRGNLFLAVGAASGSAKSQVQSFLQVPLTDVQYDLLERRKGEKPRRRAEAKVLDLQIRELIKSAKEEESDPRDGLQELYAHEPQDDEVGGRILASDVNAQSLGRLLAANEEQIFIVRAEAEDIMSKLLGNHSKAEVALLCRGWRGLSLRRSH
jgi:hypothetical protein